VSGNYLQVWESSGKAPLDSLLCIKAISDLPSLDGNSKKLLYQFIISPDVRISYYAVDSLSKRSGKAVAAMLLMSCEHPSFDVQLRSLGNLVSLGGEKMASIIRSFLKKNPAFTDSVQSFASRLKKRMNEQERGLFDQGIVKGLEQGQSFLSGMNSKRGVALPFGLNSKLSDNYRFFANFDTQKGLFQAESLFHSLIELCEHEDGVIQALAASRLFHFPALLKSDLVKKLLKSSNTLLVAHVVIALYRANPEKQGKACRGILQNLYRKDGDGALSALFALQVLDFPGNLALETTLLHYPEQEFVHSILDTHASGIQSSLKDVKTSANSPVKPDHKRVDDKAGKLSGSTTLKPVQNLNKSPAKSSEPSLNSHKKAAKASAKSISGDSVAERVDQAFNHQNLKAALNKLALDNLQEKDLELAQKALISLREQEDEALSDHLLELCKDKQAGHKLVIATLKVAKSRNSQLVHSAIEIFGRNSLEDLHFDCFQYLQRYSSDQDIQSLIELHDELAPIDGKKASLISGLIAALRQKYSIEKESSSVAVQSEGANQKPIWWKSHIFNSVFLAILLIHGILLVNQRNISGISNELAVNKKIEIFDSGNNESSPLSMDPFSRDILLETASRIYSTAKDGDFVIFDASIRKSNSLLGIIFHPLKQKSASSVVGDSQSLPMFRFTGKS